jgi:hypothetical protein
LFHLISFIVALAVAAGGKNRNPENFFKNSDFEKNPKCHSASQPNCQ